MAEHLLSLRITWSDADLLEVESTVAFRGWSANGRAYAERSDLTELADSLDRVVFGASDAALSIGQAKLGYASWRIFEHGGPRHLAVDVVIGVGSEGAGRSHDHGRECRLSVPIERGQLTEFARSLRRIVGDETGTATLSLPPDWP